MVNKKSGYTPMVQQFLEIKEQNPDVLIFFRLGDFYELFFEDAEIASKELQLYLTKKSAGNNQKINMCGVPYHAYKSYVQKLIDNGHKVGIVEQLEDPKQAQNKLVKRGIVQIITPGTNMDLASINNNYIASIEIKDNVCSICFADMSTGELQVLNCENQPTAIASQLLDKDVKEVVFSSFVDDKIVNFIKKTYSFITISTCNNVENSMEYESLFEYVKDDRQIAACLRLIHYLSETQKRDISYFRKVQVYSKNSVLRLDYIAKNNLELTKSFDNKSFGTLYWFLNHTKTPMGARLLRKYVDEPSANLKVINDRLDVVEFFVKDFILRDDITKLLDKVYDLDRIIARVGYNSANPHDLLQFKKTLETVPLIFNKIKDIKLNIISDIVSSFKDFSLICKKLNDALENDPPLQITEGGIFKKGYNAKLDELIDININCKNWISQLEQKERERTNIKTLKVGYTKVFGYYIEVSQGALSQVKDEFGYIRKQTLTTGERFITQELKEKEDIILHASDLRKDMEYKLFSELREEIKAKTVDIQNLSDSLAVLDVLISLSEISAANNFVRPLFNNANTVEVRDSRHAVVEACNKHTKFVPNDFYMDNEVEVLLITGPNMGGKSTYMRQFALNVIMAQIGMFVSASYYNCPIFDQIYTRIGASDDLVKGQSTFMLEMQEVNNALKNATPNSLILFDEIGRGTATYDGMALAQSILEYLVKFVHAKTLFSTHYHELTTLISNMKQIKNIHVGVKEEDGNVTFLYKVADGPMDKSYGINVAKLAQMPTSLLERASEILECYEQSGATDTSKISFDLDKWKEITSKKTLNPKYEEIIKILKTVDPINTSPFEALNLLFELSKKVGEINE